MLFNEAAGFPLAIEVRAGGASLGKVFTFLSGLYFRGKLAYAEAFANPSPGVPGVIIITPCAGLRVPDEMVGLDQLRQFAGVDVDERNPLYREPLERDAREIAARLSPETDVVLLGSVASSKYIDILGTAFGARLRFPADFVGRGDMSRGGLLLRCVEQGAELNYIPVAGAVRRGRRPPRLPKKKL